MAGAFLNNDMTFDGVTEGVNAAGVEEYLKYLKVDVIDKISDKIDNTDAIKTAVAKGWQGQSRDAFIANLTKLTVGTKAELYAEFGDLVRKIKSLADDYYDQDARLVDIID